MSGINNFLSKGAKPDRVKQFELLSVGKSKEEIRELEMMLLQPEEMVAYTGHVQRYVANSEFTVKLVFETQEDWDLLNKYFVVGHYIENSISKMDLLLDMMNALESGKLSYNKKEHVFSLASSPEVNIPLIALEKKNRKCGSKKATVGEQITELMECIIKPEQNSLQGEKRNVRSFFGRT